jgi:hypothetical protein
MSESGECANSCARRSKYFCNQTVGDASIGLFTKQMQSCDWDRRAVGFVGFALKVVVLNDGDCVDVILLH